MDHPTDRAPQIGSVLESIVVVSRALVGSRTTPFGDLLLTRTQLRILFVLARAREPMTPGRLASAVEVTPGAITQTMDRLRDRSLVEQSSSGLDGRVRIWRLTDAAAAQVAAFEAEAVRRATPWFASLTTDDLHALSALMRKIDVA